MDQDGNMGNIIIGIDPGVHTGVAKWSIDSKKLMRVEEMKIHQAMRCIEHAHNSGLCKLVVFEDARLRRWFGTKGRESLQGAGSIKRDSSILCDFLADLGIPFAALSPKAKGKKVDSEQFKMITGWEGRTNEHARDAAMLVYNMSDAMVASLLCVYRAKVKAS
jgi:hypothetical protein